MPSLLGPVKKAFWNGYGIAYTIAYDFYHLFKPIIEIDHDRHPPVMIFGSARSGTTWVGNVIAKMLKARQVFEPFNLTRCKYLDFGGNSGLLELSRDDNYQLYIRPEVQNIDYMNLIEAILTNRSRSSWRDKDCSPGFYRRRVIKDIRANLFMAYLAHNRPDIKIIWNVRNPINVIESQVAMAEVEWRYDWNVDYIKGQPDLLEDWLGPFLPEMEAAKSLPERLSHKWCIETFVPLKQNIGDYPNVLVVRYDKLTRGPEEWDAIKTFLQCETWDADRLRVALARPSITSRRGRAKQRSNCLSDRDIAQVTRIVYTYGLETYISP